MRILALDTSGPVCSAALSEDGVLKHEILQNYALTHSETSMPMVDDILSAARLTPADIDLFAAVAGPGSFTGVRIGVSMMRALAHATRKPTARINALQALAAGAFGARGVVCPILDARRGQVYCAAYTCLSPLPERVLPDAALPIDEFLCLLPKDVLLYFTGDGVSVHGAHMVDVLGARARIAPMSLRVLRASNACLIAALDESARVEPDKLTPIYLRAPQAERERAERLTRARL